MFDSAKAPRPDRDTALHVFHASRDDVRERFGDLFARANAALEESRRLRLELEERIAMMQALAAQRVATIRSLRSLT
jgi:hypothetical protein